MIKATLLTRVGLLWAWWYDAVMGHLVVHGVGEVRRLVLVDGHGRVVGEVSLVHHLEHVVTADLS